MVTEIQFPVYSNKIRYYDIHYRYLLNIFQFLKFDVKFYEAPDLNENSFLIYVNKKPVLIDFNDHLEVSIWLNKYPICFKYHYSNECHNKYKNLFPIGPVSFYDWDAFSLQKKMLTYRCGGDMVLNNQKPYAGALERRKQVQTILKNAYGNKVNTEIYSDKCTFWNLISNCLVSVCVPGARNDILDRGQFQYMAFGCCTISPKLNTILSSWRSLEPGIHYLVCQDDYKNLVEKIEWSKEHRKKCIQIGVNAKNLFSKTSTPNKIWSWMKQNLER